MSNTQRPDRPMIAVTGSAGKSTTKEMTASILRLRWQIFKSPGNLNFFNHTMKYAKQITPAHRAAVLEYGMSGPGQIRRHCMFVKPNVGVITNVGTAHIGNFGSDVRKLARAKSELILNMNQNGLLVLNADDDYSKLLMTKHFKGKIVTVGSQHHADYQASDVHYVKGGMIFTVKLRSSPAKFFIPIYGTHHVYNALMAIAVADHLGFSVKDMRTGLATYKRMAHRLAVHHCKNGLTVIDDSFSANPNATKASIDVLQNIGKANSIAVLGTMLEMGSYTIPAHRDVGRHIAKRRIGHLYTFGVAAKQIGIGAIKAGFPADRVHHCDTRKQLHRRLSTRLHPGDTVLVKGSHAIGMKYTADYILRIICRTT